MIVKDITFLFISSASRFRLFLCSQSQLLRLPGRIHMILIRLIPTILRPVLPLKPSLPVHQDKPGHPPRAHVSYHRGVRPGGPRILFAPGACSSRDPGSSARSLSPGPRERPPAARKSARQNHSLACWECSSLSHLARVPSPAA